MRGEVCFDAPTEGETGRGIRARPAHHVVPFEPGLNRSRQDRGVGAGYGGPAYARRPGDYRRGLRSFGGAQTLP
jgi:hypothetical protein